MVAVACELRPAEGDGAAGGGAEARVVLASVDLPVHLAYKRPPAAGGKV
jgi:hypothetical protein